jgi:hypothetical protein
MDWYLGAWRLEGVSEQAPGWLADGCACGQCQYTKKEEITLITLSPPVVSKPETFPLANVTTFF